MLFFDQRGRCCRCRAGRLGPHFSNRTAFSRSDLFFGKLAPTLNQRIGISFGLGDDIVGFFASPIEQRRRFGIGIGGLGLIFGLQRFCFRTQLGRFVDLTANFRDALVHRSRNRTWHLAPDHDQDDGDHRDRNPAIGI